MTISDATEYEESYCYTTLTLQVIVFSAQSISCSEALCCIEKSCFFQVILSVALLLCCNEYDVFSLEQLFQQVLNLYLSVIPQKTLQVFYLCAHKCLRFYSSLPLELFHMVESQTSMEQKNHWYFVQVVVISLCRIQVFRFLLWEDNVVFQMKS